MWGFIQGNYKNFSRAMKPANHKMVEKYKYKLKIKRSSGKFGRQSEKNENRLNE